MSIVSIVALTTRPIGVLIGVMTKDHLSHSRSSSIIRLTIHFGVVVAERCRRREEEGEGKVTTISEGKAQTITTMLIRWGHGEDYTPRMGARIIITIVVVVVVVS